MDIGRLKDNTEFYDGYEGEPEITLSIVDNEEFNLHIWDGHFEFIFGGPALDGKGWNGFTRDYNQMERSFGDDDFVITDVKEYLDDMLIYANQKYDYEETAECYALLRDFLEYALENAYHIKVHVF